MNKTIIKCIVVDDEQHARDLLNLYISNDNRLSCINTFSTVLELEQAGIIEQAGLLFIDVEMPGKTGLKYLTEIKNPIKSVLTTAYKDYAIDCFNLNVVDFLLKPIFEDRFKLCIDKIYKAFEIELKAKKYDTAQSFDNEYILLKSGYDELKIWLKDIIYISAEDEYVRIHTKQKEHLIYIRLKEIKTMLPNSDFTQTHRSFIVSNGFVSKIKTGSLVLNNSAEIPISRANKLKIAQIFGK
jgi:DNA-binding LytR/AlgR family response regulator